MSLNIWQKFIVTTLSFVLITACSRSGGGKKVIREDAPCFEDNKELTGLAVEPQKLFYSIVTPLADMNHALVLAPNPDVTEQNQKMTTSKKRMFDELRANCSPITDPNKKDNENLKYQTYKVARTITDKKGSKEKCPIEHKQTIRLDKEVPAFIDPNKHTKEFRSYVSVNWDRKVDTYKDLGLLKAVSLEGVADTYWFKNTPENKIEVMETYELQADVDHHGLQKGFVKVCKKYLTHNSHKYEMTVTRIGLDLKEQKAEAKYIQMVRLSPNKEGKWETDRTTRNSFYLNNILVEQKTWDALEAQRETEVKK